MGNAERNKSLNSLLNRIADAEDKERELRLWKRVSGVVAVIFTIGLPTLIWAGIWTDFFVDDHNDNRQMGLWLLELVGLTVGMAVHFILRYEHVLARKSLRDVRIAHQYFIESEES